MPDFLRKDPIVPGSPPPEPPRGLRLFHRSEKAASLPAAAQKPTAHQNGAGPAASIPGTEGEGDHVASVLRKPPLKIWTEYYAVSFLLLVGAFLTIGLLVLKPLIIRYREFGGQIATAATQLTDERAYLESLQRSIDAAQKIPTDTLEKVEEALPHGADVPKLLVILSRLAQKHGVELNSVQFSVSSGGGLEVDEIGIGMDIASPDYFTTRAYLDTLERNLQILDLQSISVSPASGQGQKTTYPIVLKTYALPSSPIVPRSP
jgi:hypothetical protein